jgi:Tfp pilus assembly protein PilF
MKAVKASVDRYFDGTQSASISMAAVVPGVEQDDATTVMRVRDTEEARAAARTVFDAKDRRKRKGWIWIPVGLLFFLLLTGGFVFAYYTEYGGGVADLIALVTGKPAPIITASAPESATSQTTTGTVVASTSDGLETSSGANDGGAASVGVETTVATQTAELVIESDATIESLEPELTAVMELEPPPVGDLTPVEESSAEVPTLGPAVSESLPSAQELLASADEQISAAMANQNTNATTAGQAEDFQLTRGPVVPRVNANVLNGYEAFQRNDLATAERSYRDALRTEPNNRDALLGLAAIAVKKDHVGLASQVYREILRVDPRDSIAQSALMSLTSNPTTSNESQLKLMLEREPEAGHLHFGLGNYYASQARWAQAQNSYFNAFRLDNDNPDYAYNLAIGLDHLAQRQAAVKYYRLALELAGDQLPGFEQAVVQKRIESITQ